MNTDEHLSDLRNHILRSLFVTFLFTSVVFTFKDFIFNQIILLPREPEFISNRFLCYLAQNFKLDICINQTPFQMINIKLAGQFTAHMLVSLIIGFSLSFPYCLWELWQFVKPALYPHEYKNMHRQLFFLVLMFSFGLLFGYYIIVPLTINFLSNYSVSDMIVNQISFRSYVSLVSSLSLFNGLVFELPLFILFFTKIGLLSPSFLRQYRRYAIVLFVAFAAIITPPDIISQILVALPLILLYEISIKISAKVYKKRLDKQN